MNDLKLQLERPNENFNLRMAIRAKTTSFCRPVFSLQTRYNPL